VSVSYSQASSLPDRKLYPIDQQAYNAANAQNEPDKPIPSSVREMTAVPIRRLLRRPRRSPR
jgi:hypothetical protein